MIGIGSDNGGFKLKEEIKKYLEESGIEYIDLGCKENENVDYPDVAKVVSKAVVTKQCDRAILVCRSGIGMSIVANKFAGIRCAICNSENMAKMSRKHTNTNIMSIGADEVEVSDAICIIRTWIATEFEGGRHLERIDLIKNIEKENMIQYKNQEE